MKKYTLFIAALFIFVLVSAQQSFSAEAVLNGTERPAPLEYLENIQFEKTDTETLNAGIKNFDISSNGNVAVGMDNNTVNIYDSEGNYLYGYSFDISGDYKCYWEKSEFALYDVRSHIKTLVSENEVKVYDIDVNEGSEFMKKYLTDKEKSYKGNKYILRKKYKYLNVFLPNYDIFSIMDKDGNEKIVIDVFTLNFSKMLLYNSIWVIVLIIGISKLKKYFKKNNR